MIRKLLLLAITTGVAKKLYRQYRTKQGGLASEGMSHRVTSPNAEFNARSDAGTTAL
jgi:hypothetical protein